MTTNIPAGYAIIDLDQLGSQPATEGSEPTQGSECAPTAQTESTTNSPVQRKARVVKWAGWMDQALVRQVLASDPLNCIRGSTAMKWVEVSTALNDLRPQPIFRSAESCRQRVKKLVEIYKKEELASLRKTGTDKEFSEFELNMVELATRWDQSSTNPETRKQAQEQALQLERDGKRVREDSMRGLVRRREEEEGEGSGLRGDRGGGGGGKRKKKNQAAKNIDNILVEFTEGIKSDKEELKEIERKQEEKHEDLMRGILGLTEEIREQSEMRSHDAYLEREARKDELVLILEALRKDNEI